MYQSTQHLVGKVTGYDENTSSFMTDITGINAYRGREVSSKSLGSIEWCSDKAKGASSLIGVVNYNDGKSNLIALESFIKKNDDKLDNYPAFKACQDLGSGWYLPALNEIKWILLHRDQLNVIIEREQGDLIEAIVHGSSTEEKKGGTSFEILLCFHG